MTDKEEMSIEYIMTDKEVIMKQIRLKRPNLKASSINLYAGNIIKLNELYGNETFIGLKFLNDINEIKQILAPKTDNTQKNYYSSIVVVLNAFDIGDKIIKHYRRLIYDLQIKYDTFRNTQHKTPKQEANWVSYDELIIIMHRLRKQVKKEKLYELSKEQPLNNKQFNLFQKLVVASLYLLEPDVNPPSRNDYSPMICIKDELYRALDKEIKKKSNYLVVMSRNKKKFAFNNFKTAKAEVDNEEPVGSKLNILLNQWLQINTSGYLLLNSNREPLSSNGLTKFINTIFIETGKKVSTTQLRIAYASHRYSADNQDKQNIADKMKHSIDQQIGYIKK